MNTPETPRASAASPVVAMEHVSVAIRVGHKTIHAVNDAGLRIGSGQFVGLVGESGSGKSTLAATLLGLLPPGGSVTGGSIRFKDTELVGLNDKRFRQIRGTGIGTVFQDSMTTLNPTRTIGAQVCEVLTIHGRQSKRARLRTAEEALALVGLPQPHQQLRKYPNQLSGGMRQRVCIAAALVSEPPLLIADEPTTALDVTTQDQIITLLQDLRTRLGMSVLLITHDMGVVARVADRVAVMYAGMIVEEGRVDEVFYNYRHRYTEALLQSIGSSTATVGRDLPSIPGMPPTLVDPPSECPFRPRCRYQDVACTRQVPDDVADERDGHRFACVHPVERKAGTQRNAV